MTTRKLLRRVLKLFVSFYESEQMWMPRSLSGQIIPAYDLARFKRFIELGRCIKIIERILEPKDGNRRNDDDQKVFEFFDRRT